LKNDIKDMRSRGFALGGSLDNAIVVDGYSVINPKGLKRKDEFVRHKMLDALGDLALSGLPLLGHYKAFCAGHKLNNQLLIKLFSNHSNYKVSVPDNINSEKYVDHNFCSTSQNYRAVI
jgi:UDP-3-O-[3-hydroxymyristoyl] N-acetylglucosamine deacetylase